MDNYQVLLVSQSGKGKTYSFRNMNPNTTGFINVENKPLPFKNRFKYQTRIKSHDEIMKVLVEYYKNPDIDCIVLDSLSACFELILEHARKNYRGFDIWNYYNETIGKLISLIKASNKTLFATAHYEILGIEGNQEKRVKVKGKELEGVIEKDFTIVMYGDNKFDDNGKPEYFFNLAQENTSAKCPPEIFGEGIYKIPNDSSIVLDKIRSFTNVETKGQTVKA